MDSGLRQWTQPRKYSTKESGLETARAPHMAPSAIVRDDQGGEQQDASYVVPCSVFYFFFHSVKYHTRCIVGTFALHDHYRSVMAHEPRYHDSVLKARSVKPIALEQAKEDVLLCINHE